MQKVLLRYTVHVLGWLTFDLTEQFMILYFGREGVDLFLGIWVVAGSFVSVNGHHAT